MVFPLIFSAVYLSHIALLRLPYYWDEAGYYIPAAYDFLRTGSLIPSTTLSNAHPPLPSIYLAFWWKLSGFVPAVTRTAMCFVAAMALLAVYRLSLALNGRPTVAIWTVLLTGIYPIWFSQSTLAHADMFAAAATLWALTFVLPPGPSPRRLFLAAICFALAALAKETAILTPLALALWEGWMALKSAGFRRRQHVVATVFLVLPVLPLLAWYAYHRAKTGFIFGNPEYLRYNATATLTPLRVMVAFGHRVLQLTAHMNLFVPVMCAAAAMMLDPLPDSESRLRPRVPIASQLRIYFVLLCNAIGFSVLGGALLTRYLLPMYPLVLLICVSTLHRRVRQWQLLMLLSAGAFIAGIFVNPPYKFAPEDNLEYSDVIVLHRSAIQQIITKFPNSTVLTAWPMTDELNKPELGYVTRPVHTVSIDNFSVEQIEKASLRPDTYTAAIVFSTKYDPPNLWLSLGPGNREVDEKYFGFHKDLDPDAIAHLLGGDVAWQRDLKGEWAAVLHFDRAQVAEGIQPAIRPTIINP
jgi:4-amino-4-deoxy-L-arabinose transferase-like glycosyltransferase